MRKLTSQRAIAEFVGRAHAQAVGEEARDRARNALLDTLAVAFAGAREPVSLRTFRYTQSQSGAPGRTPFWTYAAGGAPEEAALLNATVAHALDYDDVSPSWRGHGSAVLFPALAAMAPMVGGTIDNLLDAYVIGFEVGARLGKALIATHYRRGWHATATIGIVAATAGLCRLVNTDQVTTQNALGLAVAQAAGVQANFGTMAKPLHAGFAASGAVRAASLAMQGIDASDRAIDGPSGFADLYADGGNVMSCFETIGHEPLEILGSGVERKHFPMCYAAHRAIVASLRLRSSKKISPNEIEAISVESSIGSHDPLLKRKPVNCEEAKFSLEFNVAAAFVDGWIVLPTFTDSTFGRSDIQALASRVTGREVASGGSKRWSRVLLLLRNGKQFSETCEQLGQQSGFEEDTAFQAKIHDCLAVAGLDLEPQKLNAILSEGSQQLSSALESVPEISRVKIANSAHMREFH